MVNKRFAGENLADKIMLHIIYRSVGSENKKSRPEYYNKILCLNSLLNSVQKVKTDVNIIFVNDGLIPAERLEIMEKHGEIISLAGIGNSQSYREVLKILLRLPDTDFVYFAEDDYLYREEAFTNLLIAFAELNADYITLYDHCDRYTRKDDSYGGLSRIFVTTSMHWRTCESTCMTFGGRVEILKKDLWIHRLMTLPNTPRDRAMWRLLQGQKYFLLKYPKRTLISPLPSLASHLTEGGISPIINWLQVAEEVNRKSNI